MRAVWVDSWMGNTKAAKGSAITTTTAGHLDAAMLDTAEMLSLSTRCSGKALSTRVGELHPRALLHMDVQAPRRF